MLIMCFDYGTKNIGVSIGQLITHTSYPLKSIQMFKKKINWIAINKIINEWKPAKIIVGNPLNMNGNKQKMNFLVNEFVKLLYKKTKIPIILHDERLTTVEAKHILFNEKKGFKSLSKNMVNSVSSLIILNSWLYQLTNKK
ncbi:Holliday junction resolvase RuvX [Buchnera aphidicola (Taiwanaphis decaspermi)]|uniref:Holliday junction resolvase RuvX n=1 Tax=Buchnera aphidicola TaxID=9 RepID=UPI0031B86A9A